MSTEPIWVKDRAAMAAAGERWRTVQVVGFDTEFVRTDTYFPRPGLYQVSDGEQCWLVDPLALDDFHELAELLTDPAIVKVTHACGEDLELLDTHLGLVPETLFDTQLAWAFVGGRWEAGYAEVVAEVLGIEVDKGATRTDWCARPLSDRQVAYAVADTLHLVPLYHEVAGRLATAGRTEWMREEMRFRVAAAASPAPQEYYRGMKGASRLRQKQLTALRNLADWREQTARTLDRPRSRVVSDDLLRKIAERMPRAQAGMQDLLSSGAQRRFGADLLKAVQRVTEQELVPALPPPLSRVEGEQAAAIRKAAQQRAEELGVAEALLARRRVVEELVFGQRDGEVPASWQGWRQTAMGEAWNSHVRQGDGTADDSQAAVGGD